MAKLYIGKEIGNYCIEQRVASGSFGTVYLARHIHLKERTVVIKILHTIHLGSDEAKETFIHEAQILEKLKGLPNILPLIDVGIDDDVPYMISEYAEQGSLRARMRERSCPLPLEEALTIVSQVGKGLQEAHGKGVVHRDLKPENILFNAKGEALLADFGIATVLSTLSVKHTEVAGTPAYMAPEQFLGNICKESDQYALACIAYELLTGHKPFEAPDFISMWIRHTSVAPLPLQQLNPRIPASVECVILKALSKERTERYPSVSAFVAALDACDDPLPLPQPEPAVPSELLPLTLPPLPVEQVSQPEAAQQLEALVSAPTHTKSVATQKPDVPLPQKRRLGRRSSSLLKWGSLITIIILLAAFIGYFRFQPVQPAIGNDGIGVTSVDGEDIGISDGRYALDTDPNWVNKNAIALKREASESLSV